MISADDFLKPARDLGLDFYTGVPCSFLTPLINRVIGDSRTTYVAAASEGEAVAIAAGAWLAGRGTVVMFQNSGLGNAVNPLTSLNYPFRIPSLLICTWRAGPGLADEPQHELMGRITPDLVSLMDIPHQPFPVAVDTVGAVLGHAAGEMERTGLPFALIMEKGSVREESVEIAPYIVRPRGGVTDLATGASPPSRMAALERLLAAVPDSAALIATTGKCGRELFTIADRAQHLYQVGSMGCAAAMGLGVALNVDRPVVVVDGDGAALMKLGTLGTIGAHAPTNLIHLVLDNGTYDSTGGQPTVSPSISFADVARSCGYACGFVCDGPAGLEEATRQALAKRGPHLIHLRIARGSMKNLGRPSVKPADVARRFKSFLAGDSLAAHALSA